MLKDEAIFKGSFSNALRLVAPGTTFRLGLENILKARTGALIVVGEQSEVFDLVSGGFRLDYELTPANLYELAKMDGAIIVNQDASRILAANAQMVPDPNIFSSETGIRHRTAERVAKQTGELVIAISHRRSIITLFKGNQSYALHEIGSILIKANQALQTLEKYRAVLDKELIRLGGTEFENMVMVSEVCRTLMRSMMVLKIGQELENYIMELGTEGRLVKMQLDELLSNVEDETVLIIKDYCRFPEKGCREIFGSLMRSYEEDLTDPMGIARSLGYGTSSSVLDQPAAPRGYRILQKVPRIPPQIIENLVNAFGDFTHIMQASIEELDEVEGIGEARARSIRNGLKRMQEQLILDYMV